MLPLQPAELVVDREVTMASWTHSYVIKFNIAHTGCDVRFKNTCKKSHTQIDRR